MKLQTALQPSDWNKDASEIILFYCDSRLCC